MESKSCSGRPVAPTVSVVILISNEPSLLDLTGKHNDRSPLSATTMTIMRGTMMTSSLAPSLSTSNSGQAFAIRQWHVDDLKSKRHKSDAHKAAACLYDATRKKPNGMSIRQVQSTITSQYKVCPSAAMICHCTKEGLFNASPMKMGPIGHISLLAYKFLCQAYSSLIPISQINACAGDNSRKMMIPMIAKTLNIGTAEVKGILNCIVCNTAKEINAEKLNCLEDCHIWWTTYQNLDLWFDCWDVFVVKYGFTTINSNSKLHLDEKMKKCISNMDNTCLLLNGSNGNVVDFQW
jgi:hypothetical protein